MIHFRDDSCLSDKNSSCQIFGQWKDVEAWWCPRKAPVSEFLFDNALCKTPALRISRNFSYQLWKVVFVDEKNCRGIPKFPEICIFSQFPNGNSWDLIVLVKITSQIPKFRFLFCLGNDTNIKFYSSNKDELQVTLCIIRPQKVVFIFFLKEA